MQNGPDEIHIQIGDETVIIDGELATSVIQNAVQQYITQALEEAIERYESEKNF